jgi:hypothetical protein
MTDDLPPDEPQLWPRDPYRLLGVEYRVDARELKRAYTRLIRKFKPEHFPEQFRRIRDAYETILQHREQFDPVGDDAAGEGAFATMTPAVPPPAGDRPNARPSPDDGQTPPPFRRSPSVEQRLEAIWDLACDGNADAAYRQAVEWERLAPGDRDVCERLYWMLTVMPDLDGKRSRLDWLATGLSNGWQGPLTVLYGGELAADAAEAACDRCAQLLRTESRADRRLELVRRRWQAMEPDDALVATVGADLSSLRSRRRLGDDFVWAHLLLAALDYLAWTERGFGETLWHEVREELLSMHHLELTLAAELDRLDVLQELAVAWHALGRFCACPQLLKVVRMSWSHSAWQLMTDVDALIDQLGCDWQRSLELLDLADKHAGVTLTRVGAVLSEAAEIREIEAEVHSLETAAKLVVDHLLDGNSFQSLEFMPFNYASWRHQLAPFMIDAVIPPWQFAEALKTQRYFDLFRAKDLARDLAADQSLSCVWLVHRLFWA